MSQIVDPNLPPHDLRARGGEQHNANAGSGLAPKRSSAGVRVALFALLAVIGLVLVVVGVRVKQAIAKKSSVAKERETAQVAAMTKASMTVVQPAATTYRPRVELTGTLKPWKEADLGFETPGRLAGIRASVGDVVKAGAVLAVLDASRAGAQVSQAETQIAATQASLAIAEDNLARTQKLVDSKSVPEAQLEQAKQQAALARAQVEGARATVQIARTGAGQHALIAPFGGIITKAPTGIGGIVSPGVPIVRLEDTSRFRLSATLGEDDLSVATLGGLVKVTYRDKTVQGRIVALVPSLDQMTRRAPVEIEVPNEASEKGQASAQASAQANAPPKAQASALASAQANAKNGLIAWGFVRAVIEGDREASGMKVPPKAHRAGSQNEVVVVESGKAKMIRVSRIELEDGSWIVTNGLRETDRVIVNPPAEIAEGDPVTVANP